MKNSFSNKRETKKHSGFNKYIEKNNVGKSILVKIIFMFLLSMAFGETTALANSGTKYKRDTVDVSGVSFDVERVVENQKLDLFGKGLFKYLSLIKVVAGGLYVEPGTEKSEVLSDVPKQLELQYFISVKAKDFVKVTRKGIRQNVSPSVYDKIEAQIEQLNRLYKDIKPGDRYTLTYIPGKGTTLAHNGNPLGTIKGADFASALYSIWLGHKKPMDKKFRSALLNG